MAPALTASTTAQASAATEPMSDEALLALVGVTATGPEPIDDEPAEVSEEVTEETPVEGGPDEPVTDTADPLHTVSVDGVEQQVPLSELRRGYSGQTKITQTMQQQAAERDRIKAEADAIAASREQVRQRLELLEQTIDAQRPAEPDWDTLQREHPDEYLRQRAAHDAIERKLALVRTQRQKVEQEDAAAAQKRHSEFLREQAVKLTEALPEWKDETKYKAESAALQSYLRGNGFTDQEVAGIVDHRAVVVARKAMLYDQLQKDTKPAVQKAVASAPVIKPGASQPAKKPISKVEAARRQLAKTGSTKDAEALMLAKIEAGEF